MFINQTRAEEIMLDVSQTPIIAVDKESEKIFEILREFLNTEVQILMLRAKKVAVLFDGGRVVQFIIFSNRGVIKFDATTLTLGKTKIFNQFFSLEQLSSKIFVVEVFNKNLDKKIMVFVE